VQKDFAGIAGVPEAHLDGMGIVEFGRFVIDSRAAVIRPARQKMIQPGLDVSLPPIIDITADSSYNNGDYADRLFR
jgi:hypothetical protein